MSKINIVEQVREALEDGIHYAGREQYDVAEFDAACANMRAALAALDQYEVVEGALTSEWIALRFPWLTGRLICGTDAAVADMCREVIDAFAASGAILLVEREP